MLKVTIDQATFDGLKQAIGSEYIAELVGAFVEEAPTLIAQLRPALEAQDIETFRRAAHSLKSNAATFGATGLFELARELELMAREGRLGEAGHRIPDLEEAFERAAGDLKGMCT
jgi:HPt (histidine-containing phosphotransfer) domain-containing protein